MKILITLKRIFFQPHTIMTAIILVIYYYFIFRKAIKNSPEYNSETIQFDTINYFKKYFPEIKTDVDIYNEKYFLIKYVFSLLFWLFIINIIIF
jgi:hypothetical protein